MEPRIAVVGEAYGVSEEKANKPFVGSSGKLLTKLMSSVGIERHKCLITNVVNERPFNNNFGVYYKNSAKTIPTDELVMYREKLLKQLHEYKPTLVVPLGNEALKAIMDVDKIMKWRGSILYHDVLKCKVIATIHPVAILRNSGWEVISKLDWKRIKEEASTPYKEQSLSFEVIDSGEMLEQLFGMWHKDRKLWSLGKISFDIETQGHGEITVVGFGHSVERATVVKVNDSTTPYIKRVLESPTIPKIAHNALFDITILKDSLDINVKNLYMDTMLAHHTAYLELPRGLDFLTSIYTKRPYYKQTVKTDFYRYNALDCVATMECAIKLEKELKDLNLHDFYQQHVHPMVETFCTMHQTGVYIDLPAMEKESTNLKERAIGLQEEINTAVGKEVNVNSPKQMKKLFYTTLGLKPITDKKTGRLTTGKEAIKKYSNHPVVSKIDQARSCMKFSSTFLNFIPDWDNRLRPSFNLAGTETGRISSSKSAWGTGLNVQNIPKSCRHVFIASPEHILVESDLSQAEARIVAALSKDERQLEAFASGKDIHMDNASRLLDKPIGIVSQEDRSLAKRLTHALNYGMGPNKLAFYMGCSVAEAKALIVKHHETFPNMKNIYWQDIKIQLRKDRTLTTPFGRKRAFFGRLDDSLYREAYGFVPQSTIADWLNDAVIELVKADYRTMIPVHDSILWEIEEENMADVDSIGKTVFRQSIEINGYTVHIPVDHKTGLNWRDLR